MGKVVGIIGGVGPYAGVDFHQKILDNTPATVDQDHIEIYHLSASAKIGDRSEYLQNKNLQNPAEGIIYVAKKLISIGAEILTIPCNTAHSQEILSPFLDFISGQKVQFFNLLEETCLYIRFLGLERVGLLSTEGTYQSGIYEKYFKEIGCGELVYPNEKEKIIVNEAIYNPEKGIKSGANISWAKEQLSLIVHSIESKGVQAVVMGCTEIPLALSSQDFSLPLLDPGVILARRVVQEAL